MVEDRWQRQGLGTRVLHCLVDQARREGATCVVCLIQPDNTALLSTIRQAGFHPVVTASDGILECEIPLGRADHEPSRGRATIGAFTPLVSLLRERAELREIYPPADVLDNAVRGGA